jgi:hypothetical protein
MLFPGWYTLSRSRDKGHDIKLGHVFISAACAAFVAWLILMIVS